MPLASTALYGSTAVAVNEVTNTVYVMNEGTPSTVSVLNGATCNGRVTTGCGTRPPTVTVGNASGLAGLSVDQRTNTIYVDNTADDTISVIDGRTCKGTDTSGCGDAPAQLTVGRQSWGFVAVDPATDLVYATDYLDDSVSIINGATCNAGHTAGCNQTPPTAPVAGNPAELSVDRHNHNIYVANNGDGPVSFFRFQTPGTPTRVSASIYDGQAEVVWQPPADGGLPIIYHIIPTPSCLACTGLTTPSPSGAPHATINGLSPGRSYTFKLQATDTAGTGESSAPSNAITR